MRDSEAHTNRRIMTKPKLTFNGKSVDFETLTKSFKTMPSIELSRADVENAVLHECDNAFHEVHDIAVYKHENALHVWCGHAKVKQFLANEGKNTLKARLISKQLFKHLTVVTVPLSWQNNQAERVEKEMERQRFQEDRFSEQPPERSYGNGSRQGFRPPQYGDRRFQR
jgi:hypothetical protein